MNCPFCGAEDTRVINSRPSPAGDLVRRRRECQKCERRFTTEECIKVELTVVKRGGEREPFDAEKMRQGVDRACDKRRVPREQVDALVREVEREIMQMSDADVPSEAIGRILLRELKKVDHVAYLRFASVYKQFHDLQDFNAEIESLLKE